MAPIGKISNGGGCKDNDNSRSGEGHLEALIVASLSLLCPFVSSSTLADLSVISCLYHTLCDDRVLPVEPSIPSSMAFPDIERGCKLCPTLLSISTVPRFIGKFSYIYTCFRRCPFNTETYSIRFTKRETSSSTCFAANDYVPGLTC